MLFNEIIPFYSESYYQEIKKLKIVVVEEESTVESFAYLQGMHYTDDKIIWSTRMSKLASGKDTCKLLH